MSDVDNQSYEKLASANSEFSIDEFTDIVNNNADIDKLRERATPRSTKTLSDAKKNRIKAMKASGYTNSQIAEQLGISTSTVSKY